MAPNLIFKCASASRPTRATEIAADCAAKRSISSKTLPIPPFSEPTTAAFEPEVFLVS